MSAENVVRGQFDATTRRDFAAALNAYDEDAVLVVGTGVVPTAAGTFRGREALGKWFADWFRSFADDYRFEVEETRHVGQRVLAVARHHGSGHASGVEVEQITANLYTVNGGKIVRVELYSSRTDAIEALALAE